jgi:hypothetical protein
MPKKRKCQYRAAAVALGRPRNGHGQFASDGHTKTQPSKDTILVDLCVESAVGASPVDETDESDLLYHKRMLALAEYVEVDYDVADSDDEEDIEAVVVIPPSAPQAETTTMQTFLQRFRPAPRPILSSSEIRIIQLENKRKRQLEEAAETVHDIKNYFVPVRNGQLARVSGVDEPPDERDGKMVRSYTTMLPGTNRDGWWDNERLVAQINEVSPLFKAEHPDCELVFAFDNSCNHRAYADDALVANRMRKGDNTKTAKLMRDTYFINRHGERVEQSMRTDENKPKGIRRVLLERGLMGNRENLNFICSDCDHNILNGNARCCCVKILSSQPDFKNQKIWIEEVLDTYDIKVIFYPKFHCELNFIELMWSRLKATLRAECSFNFAELKLRLPNALETFSIPFTKKVLRHCLRYMQGYRRGLTGQLLRYAVKKYRGHRVLPGFTEEAIANQFDTYKEEKKSRKFRKLGR